jgi:catechol 2,3-dioxygenase-like lactoylglutathione lyase family enzyme
MQNGKHMLNDQELMAFVATQRAGDALAFYRDVLGLRFVADEPYALVFQAGAVTVRVQKVDQHQPLPYTTLGWKVLDIAATVAALRDKGVACERFAGMDQDELGVWASPSGARVAWFKDPDGNVLSLTQH